MSEVVEHTKGRQERRFRRWTKVLLLVFGVVAVLGVIAWLVLDAMTRAELEHALADWKAKGRPVDIAELHQQPILPEENAALVYEQAAALADLSTHEKSLMGAAESLSMLAALRETERNELEAVLRRNGEYLPLLHRAASMEQCQLEIDYAWAVTPQLTSVAGAAPALRAAALLAVEGGQVDEAWGFWQDALGTVRHLDNAPMLMGQGARAVAFTRSIDALEALVASGRLTDDQLRQAMVAVKETELRAHFARGFGDQLLVILHHGRTFGSQAVFYEPEFTPAKRFLQLLGRPLTQHDMATAVRLMSLGAGLVEQPPYAVRQQMDDWQASLEALTHRTPLSTLMLPPLANAPAHLTTAEARQATALVALALERYRLARGSYPETLSALVPEFLTDVPVDPFSGRPVLYINTVGRTVVYSVGEDLRDDGGSSEIGYDLRWGQNSPKDIVFSLRPGRGGEGAEGQKP